MNSEREEDPNKFGFHKIPLVGPGVEKFIESKLSKFDHLVAITSLKEAILQVLTKWKVDISIDLPLSTKEAMSKGPVLLIATHQFHLDMLAVIAGLPESRKDIKCFANADFLNMGKAVSEYLIPVYGVGNQETTKWWSNVWRKYGFGLPTMPVEEASQKNMESVKEAEGFLQSGGVFLIFPDGSRDEKEDWFSGFGVLMKKLTKKAPRTQVIFLSTAGASFKDSLRILGPTRFVFRKKRLFLNYSGPYKITELVDPKLKGREIASSLQEAYRSFAAKVL